MSDFASMTKWSLAIALGLSFTRPSDLTIKQPNAGTATTFHNVHWSGQAFVSPLYYVVRVGYGDAALDFTHYKIIAAVHQTVHETGVWQGQPVDGDAPVDARVQHFEISHGVNALALVGIVHDPAKRGFYAGGGPLIYLSHAESTVGGNDAQWGYGHSGYGFEVFSGVGMPAPWAEVKYDEGRVTVGVAGGTATVPLQTLHVSIAP
jgi:hypothetical protein